MLKRGPRLIVRIAHKDKPNTEFEMEALLDTGADVNVFPVHIVETLGLTQTDTVTHAFHGERTQYVPVYDCVIVFPDGGAVVSKCIAVPGRPNNNRVLIGRNTIARFETTINFMTGEWSLKPIEDI